MPRLGCNGFSLFAEQMRPALEDKLNRKLGRFNDLLNAATPYWEKMDDEERIQWKERARDYKRGDTFQKRKTESRLSKYVKKQQRSWGKQDQEDVDAEEQDEDYSDFHDPNELPGPVHHHQPHNQQKNKRTKVHKGPVSVYDLLSGNTYDVRNLINSFRDISTVRQTTGMREIPPRFRNAAGEGAKIANPMKALTKMSEKAWTALDAFAAATLVTCYCQGTRRNRRDKVNRDARIMRVIHEVPPLNKKDLSEREESASETETEKESGEEGDTDAFSD